MMTSHVADRLVELCRQGLFEQAQSELFAQEAISIEPEDAAVAVAKGLEAIQQKGRAFMIDVEDFHGVVISEPIVAGDFFSVSMTLDATVKGRGRVRMEELCVYQVNDGKIVSEQFFYTAD